MPLSHSRAFAFSTSGCSIFENCKRCNNGTWGPRDDFFVKGQYCAECRPGWSGGDCLSKFLTIGSVHAFRVVIYLGISFSDFNMTVKCSVFACLFKDDLWNACIVMQFFSINNQPVYQSEQTRLFRRQVLKLKQSIQTKIQNRCCNVNSSKSQILF